MTTHNDIKVYTMCWDGTNTYPIVVATVTDIDNATMTVNCKITEIVTNTSTTLTLVGPPHEIATLADDIHDHLMVDGDKLMLSLSHLIPDMDETVEITFFARRSGELVLTMDRNIPTLQALMRDEWPNILTLSKDG